MAQKQHLKASRFEEVFLLFDDECQKDTPEKNFMFSVKKFIKKTPAPTRCECSVFYVLFRCFCSIKITI